MYRYIEATCAIPSFALEIVDEEDGDGGGGGEGAGGGGGGAGSPAKGPPSSDEDKIKDIVVALRTMSEARLVPLRLVQTIAQYIAVGAVQVECS